ncbi:MAG: hypothetical protein R3D00_29700 [Bacteroidia bacterium]
MGRFFSIFFFPYNRICNIRKNVGQFCCRSKSVVNGTYSIAIFQIKRHLLLRQIFPTFPNQHSAMNPDNHRRKAR